MMMDYNDLRVHKRNDVNDGIEICIMTQALPGEEWPAIFDFDDKTFLFVCNEFMPSQLAGACLGYAKYKYKNP